MGVFNEDLFTLERLTGTVQDIAYTPQRITQLGWFEEEGIDTTDVWLEYGSDSIKLIPVQQRGSTPETVVQLKSKGRSFSTFHLPERSVLLASAVQNVRLFGSDNQLAGMDAKIAKLQRRHKRNILYTEENMKLGCIKGIILDADGSTELLNLFDEMGVQQNTHRFNLETSTTVRSDVVGIKRKVEKELGGLGYTGIRVLCGPNYFDKFVENKDVKAQYTRYMDSEVNRDDVRGGFRYGSLIWEEYRGTSEVKIEDDGAYAVPEGVDGLFQSYYAPADYNETVNTIGLPMYCKGWPVEGDKGMKIETQSNPLHICTRPRAIVKLEDGDPAV